MYYNFFNAHGYVVLKNAINKKDCEDFLTDVITPALMLNGTSLNDTSMDDEDKAWEDEYGAVISGEDGMNPIPLQHDKWPSFFDSNVLNSFLNYIHGGEHWEWTDGAKYGMGWIHLRYPVGDTEKWEPPDQYFGWHLDGDPDRAINQKSVVILPFINDVGPSGGGTAVLDGSHNLVAGFMNNKPPEKVAKYLPKFIQDTISWALYPIRNYLHNKIVEVTGEAGDILVMHPLLLHSSSVNLHGNQTRVTFNMATQWSR